MSFSLLVRLIESLSALCASNFEECLFRVNFSLGFFVALRMGELVFPSRLKQGGLLWEDVNGSVRLRIRYSKTDIYGCGEWIPLQKVGGRACPVVAVESYLSVCQLCSVFLVHEDGLALTRFQFAALFKRALTVVGEPPSEHWDPFFSYQGGLQGFQSGIIECGSSEDWALAGNQSYSHRVSCFRSCVLSRFVGHSYVYWAVQRADCRRM